MSFQRRTVLAAPMAAVASVLGLPGLARAQAA